MCKQKRNQVDNEILRTSFSKPVNASGAGSGSLEIAITSRGELIPNVARAVGKTGSAEVSFTPIYLEPHLINVRFNCELVHGKQLIVTFMKPLSSSDLALITKYLITDLKLNKSWVMVKPR